MKQTYHTSGPMPAACSCGGHLHEQIAATVQAAVDAAMGQRKHATVVANASDDEIVAMTGMTMTEAIIAHGRLSGVSADTLRANDARARERRHLADVYVPRRATPTVHVYDDPAIHAMVPPSVMDIYNATRGRAA